MLRAAARAANAHVRVEREATGRQYGRHSDEVAGYGGAIASAALPICYNCASVVGSVYSTPARRCYAAPRGRHTVRVVVTGYTSNRATGRRVIGDARMSNTRRAAEEVALNYRRHREDDMPGYIDYVQLRDGNGEWRDVNDKREKKRYVIGERNRQ